MGGAGPERECPAPLTIHWANCSHVGGAYASGFAFAAASLDRPGMEPDRMSEVNLVRLVTQLEARGVPSPGGLSRLDWLRAVDPTLTAAQAKAVTTCAAAFNQPRWAQLRHAVTGEPTETTEATEATPDGAGRDSTGGDETIDDGAPVPQPDRVTVGNAAQVIDFHTRLKPVADPEELDQAVTHLTDQAPSLRWEQLAKLARELAEQVRPPTNAEDHDQKRRDARGLWFTGPNAAGMVGMTGTLDPEGAAIITSAIDPLGRAVPVDG